MLRRLFQTPSLVRRNTVNRNPRKKKESYPVFCHSSMVKVIIYINIHTPLDHRRKGLLGKNHRSYIREKKVMIKVNSIKKRKTN